MSLQKEAVMSLSSLEAASSAEGVVAEAEVAEEKTKVMSFASVSGEDDSEASDSSERSEAEEDEDDVDDGEVAEEMAERGVYGEELMFKALLLVMVPLLGVNGVKLLDRKEGAATESLVGEKGEEEESE